MKRSANAYMPRGIGLLILSANFFLHVRIILKYYYAIKRGSQDKVAVLFSALFVI